MSSPETEVSMVMQGIAAGLEDALKNITGTDMHFMLMIFPTTDNARCNYISNCKREDVIEAMKSLLEKWEQGMPDIPAHEVN